MMKKLCLFAAAVASAAAFAPGLPSAQRVPSKAALTNLHMGKNIYEKKDIVKQVSEDLASSQFIFSTEMKQITVPQIRELRWSLPEDSKASCIKNRLLKRAAAGTEWEVVKDAAKGSDNLWVFVGSDIKGTIKAFKAWAKKEKKAGAKAGVLEGRIYDEKGVDAIGDLPSKDELYAQIAGCVKAVPTQMATAVKEVPTKTARAIKLAFAPDA